MNGAWVLGWDTAVEPAPRLLPADDPGAGGPEVFHGEGGNVVVFDGYLFDQGEPGRDLRSSSAARVTDAYERWEDAMVDRLRGGFTLAVWDPGRRRLLVARDAMGLAPCYYCWDGRLFLLSPSLDALLDRPEVDGRFNRVVLVEYVQDWLSPDQAHETFYEGIRRLPPAHTLSLRGGALTVARYWDPLPPGFAWASEDDVARFPDVLGRAVTRCLGVGADSLALSGGFDSISIAVLAAGQLRGKAPMHAIALRFTGTPCDEGETQRQVASALGMPLLMRTIEESLDGERPVAAAMALSGTSASPVLSPWQPMHTGLLRIAADLGLRRPLMGSGGDELFNVDLAYGADCLARLDVRELWRFCRAFQRTSPWPPLRAAKVVLWDRTIKREVRRVAGSVLDGLVPGSLARVRRRRHERLRPAWLIPADRVLQEALAHRHLDQPPVPAAPGERAYVTAIRSLPQSPQFLLEHDHISAWGRALGLTLLYPYFDRDLVELTMRLPPRHLISAGRFKTPLRRLVAERLPGVAMSQKKVDFTAVFHRVFRAEGRRAWAALGPRSALADLGIVEPRQLNAMMESYFAGEDRWGLQAWLVMSTEAWLRARTARRGTRMREEALR